MRSASSGVEDEAFTGAFQTWQDQKKTRRSSRASSMLRSKDEL